MLKFPVQNVVDFFKMFHVKQTCGSFLQMFHVKQLQTERESAIILRAKERRAEMAKIIAVANQKGGVGKTTTTVNLCAALTLLGKKILLTDCDPQGNATSGMGVSKQKTPGTYEMLISGADVFSSISQTRYGDVIPAGRNLAAASIELGELESRERTLRNALLPLFSDYDYILIDCPPSLELLTVNALTAADSVLIPMQCEYYALEGIADLMTSIKLCKRRLNPRLDIEGILLTMYDSRANLTVQVANELRRYLPHKVYETVIPRSVRLSEAPSHGKPGVVYEPSNRGSKAYMALAEEFLRKNSSDGTA